MGYHLRRWLRDQSLQRCCETHGTHCEPPSELCCERCAEAAHATFPTPHADGSPCVLDHPEATCRRCGGPNVTWSAPSPLWNRVMRAGGTIGGQESHGGIVCPTCFAQLAAAAGVAHRWRFWAEDPTADLETVTPSGRVWDPTLWLWIHPPPASAPQVKAVAVDFDGVIHTYEQGWADGTIYGSLVTGAKGAIQALQEVYAVYVHTARDPLAVARWLKDRGIPATVDAPSGPHAFWQSRSVLLVTNRKLAAKAYIDDRGIRFEGDWMAILAQLLPQPGWLDGQVHDGE